MTAPGPEGSDLETGLKQTSRSVCLGAITHNPLERLLTSIPEPREIDIEVPQIEYTGASEGEWQNLPFLLCGQYDGSPSMGSLMRKLS